MIQAPVQWRDEGCERPKHSIELEVSERHAIRPHRLECEEDAASDADAVSRASGHVRVSLSLGSLARETIGISLAGVWR
jgi:hypothetical protein